MNHTDYVNGIWAQCFRQHPDFIRTELLQDQTNPYRYLTIDYWRTESSFAQFYRQHQDDYNTIDVLCSTFTISENRIGSFVVPVEPGASEGAKVGT